MYRFLFIILFLIVTNVQIKAQERKILDIELSNYDYPYPVQFYHFTNQNQTLKMAYMDIKPSNWKGKTIVLLHGKNFNGAYWKQTIQDLSNEGYRVVVPDQIGFGKSTKPMHYQFSFQQLAINTNQLLKEIGVNQPFILGHSMGGMLAVRYALMFPSEMDKLILENPIGLEDWKRIAPYTSIDINYQNELNVTYESTKKYQLDSYYDNQWKPEYEEWVYLLTGWVKHKDYPIVAYNNAQTTDMIFTQPIFYELNLIQVPTLLIIGTRDTTAIGKQNVSEEVRRTMGNYNLLGKQAAKKIPKATLVEFENIGHLPHIESYSKFITTLKNYIK